MTDDEAERPETWLRLCRIADGILAAVDEETADEDVATVALQMALAKRYADRCHSREMIDRAAMCAYRGLRQTMIDWYAYRQDVPLRPQRPL